MNIRRLSERTHVPIVLQVTIPILPHTIPVRRHVWRFTSEPERDKSVFGVASISRLSRFRDNETGDARANVQSPHLRLL